MKVRITKAFGPYSVGHVVPDMPGNQARTLIQRGVAEECGEDRPLPANDRQMRPGPARNPQKPAIRTR